MPARKPHSKTMSEETRLEKNRCIKEAGVATRVRRSKMQVKVFDLKIVSNKLSKTQKEALTRIFLEYKWIRNYALAQQRFDLEFLKSSRENPYGSRRLGSQMQQGVIRTLNTNLRALSKLKKNGHKVGRLKFVSRWDSIDLPQFGSTYHMYQDTHDRYTKIRIQKIPGKLRVRGFEQLDRDGIEFANAKIVQRPDGWHLLVTAYLPREEHREPTKELGVDFGVKTQFTLSDGTEYTAMVEEPERLKRLQRKLSRQKKNSNSYNRTRALIEREHQRVSNRKNELARQLVHKWTEDSFVYFQDENISSWKTRESIARGSRKIQYGIMGRVKTLLQQKGNTFMLPRDVATTAWCPSCGNRSTQPLDRRAYECSCGYSEHRDIHAARNMIILGKRYKHITSGTEGSAGGEKVRLETELYAPIKRFSVKPETATSLVSP